MTHSGSPHRSYRFVEGVGLFMFEDPVHHLLAGADPAMPADGNRACEVATGFRFPLVKGRGVGGGEITIVYARILKRSVSAPHHAVPGVDSGARIAAGDSFRKYHHPGGTDAGARLLVDARLRDQPPRLRRRRAVGRAVTSALRPIRRGAGAAPVGWWEGGRAAARAARSVRGAAAQPRDVQGIPPPVMSAGVQ
eukprot:gene13622-biopygen13394